VSRERYESFEKLRAEMEESEKKWADYNPAAAAKKRR
jgi:hypothetical protein